MQDNKVRIRYDCSRLKKGQHVEHTNYIRSQNSLGTKLTIYPH